MFNKAILHYISWKFNFNSKTVPVFDIHKTVLRVHKSGTVTSNYTLNFVHKTLFCPVILFAQKSKLENSIEADRRSLHRAIIVGLYTYSTRITLTHFTFILSSLPMSGRIGYGVRVTVILFITPDRTFDLTLTLTVRYLYPYHYRLHHIYPYRLHLPLPFPLPSPSTFYHLGAKAVL